MSVIYKGNIIDSELTKNALGGSELMRNALVKYANKDLLSKVAIHVSRVREIYDDVPNILWLHDLPNDPESLKLKDPEFASKFDKFVFVSDWQMQMYNVMLGIPYSKSYVLPNAILPFEEFDTNKSENVVKIIYHTTPHRGLEILVPVFVKLVEIFKKQKPELTLELNVYSSFKIYGWDQRDEPYQKIFDICKNHENINYHGTVSNDEIRKALVENDIFAYPSIWPESSCIAAIEAMAAGCVVVCPNYAALPETTAKFAQMYQWSEDINQHAKIFFNELYNLINSLVSDDIIRDNFADHVMKQIDYFNYNYDWKYRANQWNHYLDQILVNYYKSKNYLTFNTGGDILA